MHPFARWCGFKKKKGLSLRAQRDLFKCKAFEAVDQSKSVESEVTAKAA